MCPVEMPEAAHDFERCGTSLNDGFRTWQHDDHSDLHRRHEIEILKIRAMNL